MQSFCGSTLIKVLVCWFIFFLLFIHFNEKHKKDSLQASSANKALRFIPFRVSETNSSHIYPNDAWIRSINTSRTLPELQTYKFCEQPECFKNEIKGSTRHRKFKFPTQMFVLKIELHIHRLVSLNVTIEINFRLALVSSLFEYFWMTWLFLSFSPAVVHDSHSLYL